KIGDHEFGWFADDVRRKVANVRSIEDANTRVGTKPPVELAVPDVDGDDLARAALQQNVGEASRRCTRVKATSPCYRQTAESIDSSSELVSPARRKVRRMRLDAQRGMLVDCCRRFRGALSF